MSIVQNLLGPRKRFDGGLFLPDQKAGTARRPIEALAIDGPLYVPLRVRQDLETTVEVRVGDRVLGGQRIARAASEDSVSIHAPTSGRVMAVDRAWTAADGFLPCMVIEPDTKHEPVESSHTWESESFVSQLAGCGVVCPRPRMPAHSLIRDAAAAGVTDIIVNAMETEPYLTADLRTLVEQPGRLIDTTCEFADALGVRHVSFALPFRHRRVVKRIESEVEGRQIEVVPLANRYPQCDPVVLVKTILDREVEPGSSVLGTGTLVLPLAVVRSAADAIFSGRPVTHALMTIAGDAVERPGTYRVAIGTPMRRLAERVGVFKIVMQAVSGGPLTGISLGRDDAVVTADTTSLLLYSSKGRSHPVPCIHCGWCVEDCPVGLDPSMLMQVEAQPSCDPITLSQLQACVDCGLCSYVCPAQLPLAASISRARRRFEADRQEAIVTD